VRGAAWGGGESLKGGRAGGARQTKRESENVQELRTDLSRDRETESESEMGMEIKR
jgi:hypothetical protein